MDPTLHRAVSEAQLHLAALRGRSEDDAAARSPGAQADAGLHTHAHTGMAARALENAQARFRDELQRIIEKYGKLKAEKDAVDARLAAMEERARLAEEGRAHTHTQMEGLTRALEDARAKIAALETEKATLQTEKSAAVAAATEAQQRYDAVLSASRASVDRHTLTLTSTDAMTHTHVLSPAPDVAASTPCRSESESKSTGNASPRSNVPSPAGGRPLLPSLRALSARTLTHTHAHVPAQLTAMRALPQSPASPEAPASPTAAAGGSLLTRYASGLLAPHALEESESNVTVLRERVREARAALLGVYTENRRLTALAATMQRLTSSTLAQGVMEAVLPLLPALSTPGTARPYTNMDMDTGADKVVMQQMWLARLASHALSSDERLSKDALSSHADASEPLPLAPLLVRVAALESERDSYQATLAAALEERARLEEALINLDVDGLQTALSMKDPQTALVRAPSSRSVRAAGSASPRIRVSSGAVDSSLSWKTGMDPATWHPEHAQQRIRELSERVTQLVAQLDVAQHAASLQEQRCAIAVARSDSATQALALAVAARDEAQQRYQELQAEMSRLGVIADVRTQLAEQVRDNNGMRRAVTTFRQTAVRRVVLHMQQRQLARAWRAWQDEVRAHKQALREARMRGVLTQWAARVASKEDAAALSVRFMQWTAFCQRRRLLRRVVGRYDRQQCVSGFRAWRQQARFASLQLQHHAALTSLMQDLRRQCTSADAAITAANAHAAAAEVEAQQRAAALESLRVSSLADAQVAESKIRSLEAAALQHIADITALRTALTETQAGVDSVSASLSTAMSQLQESRQEAQRWRDAADTAVAARLASDSKMATVQASLMEREVLLNDAVDTVQRLRDANAALRVRVEAFEHSSATAAEALARETARAEAVEYQLAATRKSLAAAEDDVSAQRARLASAKEKIEKLDADRDELQAKLAAAQETANARAEELSKLSGHLQVAAQVHTDVKSAFNATEARAAELESALKTHQARAVDAVVSIAKLQAEVTSLRDAASSTTADKLTAEARCAELTAQVRLLEGNAEQFAVAKQQLSQELNDTRAELQRAKDTQRDAELAHALERSSLRAEVERLTAQVSHEETLKRAAEDRAARLNDAEVQLVELRAQKATLDASISALRSALDRAVDQERDARNAGLEYAEKLEHMQAKLVEAQQQLQTLQSQAAQTETAVAAATARAADTARDLQTARDAQAQTQALSDRHAARVLELEELLRAVDTRVAQEADARIQSLSRQAETLQTRVDELSHELEQARTAAMARRGESDDITRSFVTDAASTDVVIDGIAHDVRSADSGELRALLMRVNSERLSLRTSLMSSRLQIDSMQRQGARTSQTGRADGVMLSADDLSTIRHEMQEQQDVIARLEDENTALISELASSEMQITELRRQLSAAAADSGNDMRTQALTEQVHALQQSQAEAHARADALQLQLLEAAAAAQTAQHSVSRIDLDSEVVRLRNELDAASGEGRTLRAATLTLQRAVAQLQTQLTTARAELEERTATLYALQQEHARCSAPGTPPMHALPASLQPATTLIEAADPGAAAPPAARRVSLRPSTDRVAASIQSAVLEPSASAVRSAGSIEASGFVAAALDRVSVASPLARASHRYSIHSIAEDPTVSPRSARGVPIEIAAPARTNVASSVVSVDAAEATDSSASGGVSSPRSAIRSLRVTAHASDVLPAARAPVPSERPPVESRRPSTSVSVTATAAAPLLRRGSVRLA